jgi:hypothetical protein
MKPAISIAALAALALPFGVNCQKDAPTNNDNLQPAVVTQAGGSATPPPGHGAAGHGGSAAPAPAPSAPSSASVFEGKIKETMNSGGYTYLLVQTAKGEVWAAAPETTVKVGDKASFPGGMAMDNFHSATLKRTFPVIYFVSSLEINGSVVGATGANKATPAPPAPAAPATASLQVEIKGIEKAKDGKTIGELFASKAEMSGKPVSVRGVVVKYNSGIMGSNWIHIKDGSGSAGTDDLTLTTQDTAKIGDKVLIQGVVALDKNFGGGYKYNLIVENAKVTVE